METYERATRMHCFYVYVVNGEELMCEREPSNRRDRCAVAFINDDDIICYLPRNISRICSLFLQIGRSTVQLSSKVTFACVPDASCS